MTVSALPDEPADLRMDVLGDGEASALLPTGVGNLALLIDGWFESHSTEGGRGAHLAIRQARQRDAVPIVVHVSQVPALVAALTEVSLRLTQLWNATAGSTGPGSPHRAGPARRTPDRSGSWPSRCSSRTRTGTHAGRPAAGTRPR